MSRKNSNRVEIPPRVAAKPVQMPPLHSVGIGNKPVGFRIAIAWDGVRTAVYPDGRVRTLK